MKQRKIPISRSEYTKIMTGEIDPFVFCRPTEDELTIIREPKKGYHVVCERAGFLQKKWEWRRKGSRS